MQWTQNICRICGQINETCHLIFNKSSENDIENKIKKCLKIELFKDDYKPKQLCNVCLLKLNDFSHFIDICYATDEKFETMLLNRHQWPNENNIIDYTQQKMSVIVNPKPIIEQLDCSDIDLYKEMDNINVTNCSINEQEMLEIVENTTYTNDNVNYLNNSYNLKNYYGETSVLRHSSNYQDNSCSSNSNAVINYSCQQQDKSITPEMQYKETEDLYKKNYYVNMNNYNINYPNYDNAPKQIEEIEDKNKKIKIISVETIEKSIKFLPITEKKAEKPKKTFNCPHCDKTFKRRVTLNSHLAIHTKIRPFICDICKRSYAIKCDLTNHQKAHTDRNKCNICESSFSAPSKLQRHLRIHTKDKPFVCDFQDCHKSFSDKRNLIGHQIVHCSVHNFSCKECGKAFKSKNSLKQHGKAHSESVPYECDVCTKRYKYKSTLILHMKKHSGYFCPYCNKDCERRAKLIKHKRECHKKTD